MFHGNKYVSLWCNLFPATDNSIFLQGGNYISSVAEKAEVNSMTVRVDDRSTSNSDVS